MQSFSVRTSIHKYSCLSLSTKQNPSQGLFYTSQVIVHPFCSGSQPDFFSELSIFIFYASRFPVHSSDVFILTVCTTLLKIISVTEDLHDAKASGYCPVLILLDFSASILIVTYFLLLKTMPYFDSCDIILTCISSWLSGYFFSICFVGSSSSIYSSIQVFLQVLFFSFDTLVSYTFISSVTISMLIIPKFLTIFQISHFQISTITLSIGHIALIILQELQSEHVKI